MSAPPRRTSLSGSSTSTARDPTTTSTTTTTPAMTEKSRHPQPGRQGGDKDADDARDQENKHDGPPDDIRYYLPTLVGRFVGYRTPGQKPPFEPFPLPPFSWLNKIPLKYENYLWSTIGSFVGILLIEIVMIRAFADTPGTGLIVAAFGAGAVLAYSQFESPLAQPRSIIGGSAISCVIAVGLTKLFRLSGRYGNVQNLDGGELGTIGWINGALSMSLALLAMQLTGTTHPPGGAAALVAATQQGAMTQGWRYIYIVMVSACLELGWALLWNVSPESGSRSRLRGTLTFDTCRDRTWVEDVIPLTGSHLLPPLAPGRSEDYAETPSRDSTPRPTKRHATHLAIDPRGTRMEIIGTSSIPNRDWAWAREQG